MKKFFLIPLMTLMCSVMAWGTEIEVSDFASLKAALSSGTADVVKMTQDIAYPTNGSDLLNITRSVTLDGQNHKIIGWGTCNVSVSGTNNQNTTLAINVGSVGSALEVTIENISIMNTKNKRYYGIIAFDEVSSLSLKNVKIESNGNYSAQQSLCFAGVDATPINLTIEDSYIDANVSGYPAYILKPLNANIKSTTIKGYCGLYFKYQQSNYGNTIGSRGSTLVVDACNFICPNVHDGASNEFALLPFEEDGINLTLINCSMNAEQIGNQSQAIVSLQWLTRTSGYQPVVINVEGDNTHLYNVTANNCVWNYWAAGNDGSPAGEAGTHVDIPFTLNITGGTFTFNPDDVTWDEYENLGNGSVTIPATHEVQEVKQGDATLYRVVKKAAEKTPGVLYDLNDFVAGEGEDYGDNPVSSFDLSNGDDMTLNNEVTTAGYVSVSDDPVNGGTTVTVGQTAGGDDQTLIINNGLSVEGSSQVIVETGANLMIGEGGITTEDPSNIVIEANENGAASLLLEPSITVNQNPYLTVKMETNVGKFVGSGVPADIIWVWHYFAFPMKAGASWTCTDGSAVVPTYFQGWNYGTNDWESIVPATMKPFYGYILTYDKPYTGVPGVEGSHGTKVTYTFTGNLVGNEDLHLEFSAMGWNFFGNSYTAYISTKTFLDNIINDPNVGATIYLWDSKDQQYRSFTRDQINTGLTGTFAWANEVAPMQTFILQKRQAGDPQVEVNYAEAIWNNPRYVRARGESSPAPARVQDTNSARAYITIAAANGQNDYICLMEDAKYSDAYDNGGDGAKYMNAGRINMYITANNEDYGTLATDNLAGKAISFQTNDQINYTLSISDVLGSQYAIRDIMTNTVISMTEGATYDFVAQPNSTIEGRFVIVPMQNMPTNVETVENNATVKGIYTIMGQYVGEDFDILPAGVYVVDGVKVVK